MPSPPSFCDLTGQADGLFDAGFDVGFCSVKCNTKTAKEVEFNVELRHDQKNATTHGNLTSTLYKNPEHGVSISSGWDTDNILSNHLTAEDAFQFKGVSLAVENAFKPKTKENNAVLKINYNNEHLNLNKEIDIQEKKLSLAAVAGYEGWTAGCNVAVNVANKELVDNQFCVGYQNEKTAFHASITNMKVVGAKMYQKVNDKFSTGAFLNFTKEDGANFGMAAQYVPHTDVEIKGKMGYNGDLGFSYKQQVQEGLFVTFSSILHTKSMTQSLGLGFEFKS